MAALQSVSCPSHKAMCYFQCHGRLTWISRKLMRPESTKCGSSVCWYLVSHGVARLIEQLTVLLGVGRGLVAIPLRSKGTVLLSVRSRSCEDLMFPFPSPFLSVSPPSPHPRRCWWNERCVRVEEKSSALAGLVQPPPETARSRHS